MATAADHIDIREDVSGMTPDEYETDVNERYDLAKHPDVEEVNERIENLKASARQAFEDAKRLREEAAETEEKAGKVAAGQAEGSADALFEEAATKEQKAERKKKEARAKANALKQLVGTNPTKMFLGKHCGVENPAKYVDDLEPVAQTRRDEIHRQAEREVRAAAEKELETLLPELRERWDKFAELFRKARVLSTRSFGAYSTGIGPLSGGEVDDARNRLEEALQA